MKKPFFSIIITVFNKQEFIKATINSVLSQTFYDYEIIIINDCSTDDSLTIIKSFEDSNIKIIDQENLGASKARNIGINQANGSYIALLDGDDLWDTEFLKTIYKAIIEHPKFSVFATAIAHKYDEKIVPVTYSFSSKEEALILDYFENSLKHPIISSSSIVFKKEIIAVTGNFNESIISGQDTDLWIRIGINFKIVFINKILAHYVYSSKSLSNSTFNLASKPRYDGYYEFEKNNKPLKKYLDKNRYSLAIMSKLYKDEAAWKFYKSQINFNNLTLKQQFLFNSPAWLLNLLLKWKSLKGQKLYYKPL